MKILVTGGAGFIGAHLTNKFYSQGHNVVVLDKFSKTASYNRFKSESISIIKDRIQNPQIWNSIDTDFDLVVNTAAETHVDLSFTKPENFIDTNILGLHYLSKFCADHKIPLIHLSTDEVIGTGKPLFEDSMVLPTNPYAATKASGESILHAYGHCYNLNWKILRLNNVYGTMQFPDKLIPFFISQLNKFQYLPIHGTGKQVRFFLHIDDFADALMIVHKKGIDQNIYNVSTNESYTVLEIAKMICDLMEKDFETNIQFVIDRISQDPTYLSNSDKLRNLGWIPKNNLKDTLPELIQWYTNNIDFFSKKQDVLYF